MLAESWINSYIDTKMLITTNVGCDTDLMMPPTRDSLKVPHSSPDVWYSMVQNIDFDPKKGPRPWLHTCGLHATFPRQIDSTLTSILHTLSQPVYSLTKNH